MMSVDDENRDGAPQGAASRRAAQGAGARRADGQTDGRATRWASHRINRRSQLVRECAAAVAALGADASMDDLAEHVGTSKSILYRYFTDRSGLQRAVGEAIVTRMKRDLGAASEAVGGPRERILAMVSVYLETISTSPEVYAFVTRTDAAAGQVRGLADDVALMVADMIVPDLAPANGTADRIIAADLWSANVVGSVRAVGERWLAARSAHAATADGDGPEPLDTSSTNVSSQPAAGLSAAIAELNQSEVAALLATWLWDGAVGVLRRGRNATEPSPPNTVANDAVAAEPKESDD